MGFALKLDKNESTMRLSTLVTLALTLFLTACGFKLRSFDSFQFALKEVNFVAADRYSSLAKAVEEQLKLQGVELNPTAEYTLLIGPERDTRRTVSYIAGTRNTEELLTTSVDYAIRAGNLPELITGRAEVQRTLTRNQNLVSASSETETQARNEMRNDLVMQLMLRLQAIQPAELDKLHEEAQARADEQEQALQQQRERLLQEYQLSPLPETIPAN